MVALYGACICSQGGRSFLEVFHWLQHDIVDRGRLLGRLCPDLPRHA